MPDKWADAEIQKFVHGVDVMKEAEEKFDELFAMAE